MADAETKLQVSKENRPAPPAESSWSPFESLHREIDRLFDDLRPGNWHFPFSRRTGILEPAMQSMNSWRLAPAIDLVEKDNCYEISAELPGMDEKDVEVKLANGTLTITGEKSEEKEEQEKDYYLSERRYGSFSRSFRIPEGVDIERIEAKFTKGVLTVELPKTTEAKKSAKKIEVKAT